MRIGRVLVVYKKSSFETHTVAERDPLYLKLLRQRHVATRLARTTHQEHQESVKQIKSDLRELQTRFDIRLRYHLGPIRGYDLVITIGGDGTFLETSHFMSRGILFGVNSAPTESVGFYCRANRFNFRQKFVALLRGRQRLQKLSRLKMTLKGRKLPLVLNDLLFTNSNPAGTTRYILRLRKTQEEQKSSGVWVSPAPGSTAAIHSAGGRILPLGSDKFQYVVREPYQPYHRRYRLLKGVLGETERLTILSMMDEAAIYLDGPHEGFAVRRGETIVIKQANHPLYAVW